jgi:hypothetical protein
MGLLPKVGDPSELYYLAYVRIHKLVIIRSVERQGKP